MHTWQVNTIRQYIYTLIDTCIRTLANYPITFPFQHSDLGVFDICLQIIE